MKVTLVGVPEFRFHGVCKQAGSIEHEGFLSRWCKLQTIYGENAENYPIHASNDQVQTICKILEQIHYLERGVKSEFELRQIQRTLVVALHKSNEVYTLWQQEVVCF
jgi:hypothetical protein